MLLTLLCLMFSSTACFASTPMHAITFFQYHMVNENGRDMLRVEIGFDRADLVYQARTRETMNKQLLVDLQDTDICDIRRNVALDGTLGRYLTFRELERGRAQVAISCSNEVTPQNYKVYTLPADRQQKKPYRLVIDIMAPAAVPTASTDRVDGLAGKVIVVDPGHGGSDSGALGAGGSAEKDVTLAVSKKVQAILQNSGARVAMTRTDDRDVYAPNDTASQELQARVDVASYTPGAQVFLCIHCNSFSNPSAHGTESYYYPKSDQDAVLAQDLQDAMLAVNGLSDRGVKEANFYVMKHTDIPASLVELAFISNDHEEQLLNAEDFQNKIALALCKGLSKFFQDTGL